MHYQPRKTAMEEVSGVVAGVSFGFVDQALRTFQTAFTFTLGLLTHELVLEVSSGNWHAGKFVSWLLFMVVAFVFPYLIIMYERCAAKVSVVGDYGTAPAKAPENVSLGAEVFTAVNSSGHGSAHHFYGRA